MSDTIEQRVTNLEQAHNEFKLQVSEFIAASREHQLHQQQINTNLEVMIARHDKLLMGGNGFEGLVVQVDRVKQENNKHSTDLNRLGTKLDKLSGKITGFIITTLSSLAVGAILLLLKIRVQ